VKGAHNKAAISDELKKILGTVAELLLDCGDGKKINPATAYAYSITLRRIIEAPKPSYTAAEQLEMMVAISYAIRKELLGPGRGNAKKARAETAKFYQVNDATVSTYSSRWKKDVDELIEKITSAQPLPSRADVLKSKLLDVESVRIPQRKKFKRIARASFNKLSKRH
jgi:hypothetical protein